MTLSRQLAAHIAEFDPARLPLPTQHATQAALLDGCAVTIAASALSDDVQPFLHSARLAPGPCPVLGAGFSATPEQAALANGALAHALDFEDTFDARALHPNAAVIPTLISLCHQPGAIVSGPRLLSALALGCDVTCRLGLAIQTPLHTRGWYPPMLLGALGAAAAGAHLQRLSVEQTLSALSLVLCNMSAPAAIGADATTTLRATREAFAAAAAVRSVQLAGAGVVGFAAPLEGRGGFFEAYTDGAVDHNPLLDGLGEHFWGEQLSFKLWPTCRGTHGFIELGLQLRQMLGGQWHRIDQLTVDIGEIQTLLIDPLARKAAPASVIDAKFSIPYTLALALAEGEVNLANVPRALADRTVRQLAARITPRYRRDWGADKATAAKLEAHFNDGTPVWSGECLTPLGAPERPLAKAQREEKVSQCLQAAGTPFEAPALIHFIDRLPASTRVDFSAFQG